jgi:hypothetical protein
MKRMAKAQEKMCLKPVVAVRKVSEALRASLPSCAYPGISRSFHRQVIIVFSIHNGNAFDNFYASG